MPPITMEGGQLGEDLNCANYSREIDVNYWEGHTSVNVNGYFPQLKSQMLRDFKLKENSH